MAEEPTKAETLQPVIILSQPQMGENIGATARVMRNFGLLELRIISPRDGWPNEKSTAMASDAGCCVCRSTGCKPRYGDR